MDRLLLPHLILGEFKQISELFFPLGFLMISGGIDSFNSRNEI